MRQALRIVRPGEAVAGSVPWWRSKGVVITGQVVWWLVTYVFWLAVAVVGVALVLISVVCSAIGAMAHFTGNAR